MDIESVATIEALLRDQKHQHAAQELANTLQSLLARQGFFTTAQLVKYDPLIIETYTRLAQCFNEIITHPEFVIEREYFFAWLMHARAIQSVFAISKFNNTKELTEIFSAQLKELAASTQPEMQAVDDIEQALMKLLLSYSLDNEVMLDFASLVKFAPEYVIPTIWEMLATHVFCGEICALAKEQLLGTALKLPVTAIIDTVSLLAINTAWMMSSYYTRRDKHYLKHYFNQLLQRFLKEYDFPTMITHAVDNTRAKPLLMVVLEIFSSHSALYKGYATALQALQTDFDVVAVFFTEQYDENAARLFERYIVLERKRHDERLDVEHFKQQVADITHLRPDIILYPCIGMHDACIMLANMRLAPIQIMSYGCAASSYSPHIDFGIIEEDYLPASVDLHTEKLIVLPRESLPIIAAVDNNRETPEKSASAEQPLTLMVASITYKISQSFLQACQQIMLRANRPLRIVFMLGDTELSFLQGRKRILELLPYAEVLPLLPFDNYLAVLELGDILLSTFPFCGTNTVVDALCLGLPVVCLQSEDIAGRTDSALLQRRNLPDWLVTQTADDYIAAALRLLHNDAERLQISQMARASRLQFSLEHNPNYLKNKDNLAKACKKIYEQYQSLRENPAAQVELSELVSELQT